MNKNITFEVIIEVDFESFSSIKKNKKAVAAIKKWIKSANKYEKIPLYINKDNGSMIESHTTKPKVKINMLASEMLLPNWMRK